MYSIARSAMQSKEIIKKKKTNSSPLYKKDRTVKHSQTKVKRFQNHSTSWIWQWTSLVPRLFPPNNLKNSRACFFDISNVQTSVLPDWFSTKKENTIRKRKEKKKIQKAGPGRSVLPLLYIYRITHTQKNLQIFKEKNQHKKTIRRRKRQIASC